MIVDKNLWQQSVGIPIGTAIIQPNHETIHGSEKLSEIDLKSYVSKITT